MKSVGGIFIKANDEQLAEIWEACAANGFTLDSDGILSLLMLAVHDEVEYENNEDLEEKPDVVSGIVNHFVKNPEHAEALKDAGAKLLQKLFKKPQ